MGASTRRVGFGTERKTGLEILAKTALRRDRRRKRRYSRRDKYDTFARGFFVAKRKRIRSTQGARRGSKYLRMARQSVGAGTGRLDIFRLNRPYEPRFVVLRRRFKLASKGLLFEIPSQPVFGLVGPAFDRILVVDAIRFGSRPVPLVAERSRRDGRRGDAGAQIRPARVELEIVSRPRRTHHDLV